MATFFTSDTHFGHANIIRLSNRPFADVDEMDETMISNFNEQAGPEDTIFHLGDACMGKLVLSLQCIARINARVVLIPGNHDRTSASNWKKFRKPSNFQRFYNMYQEVFENVYMEREGKRSEWIAPIYPAPNWPIKMSHYPYTGDSHGEERYRELRPRDEGGPLIHGHVHEQWKFNGRMFNVGVDRNDFRLVTQDEVLDWAGSL